MGKLGLALVGRAMLSESLIQFSIAGWGCVSSLLFDLRPSCGRGSKIVGTSFQRSCARTAVFSAPDPAAGHCPPLSLLETPGLSQGSLTQPLAGRLLLFPGSWCTQVLCVHKSQEQTAKSLFLKSCGSFVMKYHWPPTSKFLEVLSPFVRSLGWGIYYGC